VHNWKLHIVMKELLQSLVRHLLTFLVGLGTTLHHSGLLAAEDVTAVNEAGVTLQAVLAGIVVAVLMRLGMRYGGKIFWGNGVQGSGSLLLLLGLMVAGLAGTLGLSSCTPEQREAAQAVPIKACYVDERGNRVCYSSTSGVEVEVRSAK
jgi:hypothetical protein